VSDAAASLSLTGERTLPGIWHEQYWFARHEVAYRFVASMLATPSGGVRRLLDAGCGEGYGADRLRAAAHARVVALDYDDATSAHAHDAYPRLRVLRANLVALPLRTASLDAVVSLQTVEHVWDQPAFAAECARVLRRGGQLVISTPNRLTFPAGNAFHFHELDAGQLLGLLRGYVLELQLLGVHHGPRIATFEADHGDLVRAQLRRPYGDWDGDLATFVATVRPEDFVVATNSASYRIDESLDLLAVGQRR
jgi:SAM-dependent methyltransferase